LTACEARIVIETENSVHLVRALEPDNLDAPGHVSVECRALSGLIECAVRVDGCEDPKRVLTLRNTVDEIILISKSVENALAAMDKAENTL